MIGDFRVADVLGLLAILLALGYLVANRRFLPGGLGNRFFLAFLFFAAEILAANLERVLLPELFNLLEHTLRAAFAVTLAFACWNPGPDREEERS